jgi:hypothetical protein
MHGLFPALAVSLLESKACIKQAAACRTPIISRGGRQAWAPPKRATQGTAPGPKWLPLVSSNGGMAGEGQFLREPASEVATKPAGCGWPPTNRPCTTPHQQLLLPTVLAFLEHGITAAANGSADRQVTSDNHARYVPRLRHGAHIRFSQRPGEKQCNASGSESLKPDKA